MKMLNSINPFTGLTSLISSFLFLPFISLADSFIHATRSGNWNDPNVWSCHCVPAQSDNVIIGRDHWLTITRDEGVKNLTIEHNGALEFSWLNVVTLSVTGDLICEGFIDPGLGIMSFSAGHDQKISGYVDLYKLHAQGKKKLTLSGYINVYNSIHVRKSAIYSVDALHIWTENPVFRGIFIEDRGKLKGNILKHGVLGIVEKTDMNDNGSLAEVYFKENLFVRKEKYENRPIPAFKTSDIRPLHERIFDRNQAFSSNGNRLQNLNR